MYIYRAGMAMYMPRTLGRCVLYHNQAPYTTALAHAPSNLTERATHAHPLHPAALASVPSGEVLVRVPFWRFGVNYTRPGMAAGWSPLAPQP